MGNLYDGVYNRIQPRLKNVFSISLRLRTMQTVCWMFITTQIQHVDHPKYLEVILDGLLTYNIDSKKVAARVKEPFGFFCMECRRGFSASVRCG
jgi:hypothetical protein